ncbi:hypothetical protein pdam_00010191 [Pocillopora damicornis]|uniref:Homeobox domain-containing protein n=1 Tax=Pocillopora damicornis TaxID=46731 RepID=A0A3M6T453_POCDA|nr:hypothetical protein pdam_00010191 [Pocillopora damicornis]
MASFRIDDILARPQVSRSQTGSGIGASTPIPNYQQLSFGVDQILARHETEQRERLPVLGAYPLVPSACDHLHATYWASPYLATHAQPLLCGSLLHSNCEACYSHTPYSYSPLTGQVLPGQPKPRKPRRPWTRAVFSNLQRKGLEKRFQLQKYLTKADRHQLASMLGLSDNQVKVWFQNRRMKWRQEARETITTGSPEEGSDKQDQ